MVNIGFSLKTFTHLCFSLVFLVLALVELGRWAFFGEGAASTSSGLLLVSNSFYKATSNQSSVTNNCLLNRPPLVIIHEVNLTVNQMLTDLDYGCVGGLVSIHRLTQLSLHLLLPFSVKTHEHI